jgi:hypothetical protein
MLQPDERFFVFEHVSIYLHLHPVLLTHVLSLHSSDPTILMQSAVGFEHLVGPGQAYAAMHMINEHGNFLLSLLPRICMWNQDGSIK